MNGAVNGKVELVDRIRHLQIGNAELTPSLIADHVGVTRSSVQRWMNGHLKSAAMDASVSTFIGRVEGGEISLSPIPRGALRVEDIVDLAPRPAARRQGPRMHYELEITRRVWKALDYCHDESKIVFVDAVFGGGKTHAIREWIRARKANVVRLEFNQFIISNRKCFIARLARALGLEARGIASWAGDQLFQAVIDRLNAEPALLIFDQAEGAREPVLQVIRQIWDHTHESGVGVAIFAQKTLYERLRCGSGREVGALTSRIGLWARLDGITYREMVDVLRQEGFKDIDERALMSMWKGVASSTRVLFNAIEMLRAKHKGSAVREGDVDKLIATLRGNGGAR